MSPPFIIQLYAQSFFENCPTSAQYKPVDDPPSQPFFSSPRFFQRPSQKMRKKWLVCGEWYVMAGQPSSLLKPFVSIAGLGWREKFCKTCVKLNKSLISCSARIDHVEFFISWNLMKLTIAFARCYYTAPLTCIHLWCFNPAKIETRLAPYQPSIPAGSSRQ